MWFLLIVFAIYAFISAVHFTVVLMIMYIDV